MSFYSVFIRNNIAVIYLNKQIILLFEYRIKQLFCIFYLFVQIHFLNNVFDSMISSSFSINHSLVLDCGQFCIFENYIIPEI